jgi:hypothetical protein
LNFRFLSLSTTFWSMTAPLPASTAPVS